MKHKHLAFVIPLRPGSTKISIFSRTDMSICLESPPTPTCESRNRKWFYSRGTGTNLFLLRTKSRSRAVDWVWKLWYVVSSWAERRLIPPHPFQAAAWRRNPRFYHDPLPSLRGEGGIPHSSGGLRDWERGMAYVHPRQGHRELSEADERDTRLGCPGGGTDTKGREIRTLLEKREQAGLGLAGAR